MSTNVSLTTRLEPASDVLFRALEDESVLVHLKGGSYFGLDPVGTRIWTWLPECDDLAGVLAKVVEAYDVETERAQADLLRLASELLERELVVTA